MPCTGDCVWIARVDIDDNIRFEPGANNCATGCPCPEPDIWPHRGTFNMVSDGMNIGVKCGSSAMSVDPKCSVEYCFWDVIQYGGSHKLQLRSGAVQCNAVSGCCCFDPNNQIDAATINVNTELQIPCNLC